MPHPELEPLLAEGRRAGCDYPYAYAAGALAVKLSSEKSRADGLRILLARAADHVKEPGLSTRIELELRHQPTQ